MNNNVFKRVISNPDQVGREQKISRTSMNEKDTKGDVHIGNANADHSDRSFTTDAPRSLEQKEITGIHANIKTNQDGEGQMMTMMEGRHKQGSLSVQKHQIQGEDYDAVDGNSNINSYEDTEIPRQVSVDCGSQMNSSVHTEITKNTNTRRGANPEAQIHFHVDDVRERFMRRNRLRSSSGTVEGSTGQLAKDWGWFEDVHEGEGEGEAEGDGKLVEDGDKETMMDAISQSVHSIKDITIGPDGKKKGTLIPAMDSNAEEVVPEKVIEKGTLMAVTAPTYVLEESRSSQTLWKQTAGNRPPQPVDERAFFERIWAQNFQRSQVDYKIPEEVLTAGSPVALSPFADGNFEASICIGSTDGQSETDAVSTITSKTDRNTFYGNSDRNVSLHHAMIHDNHHTLVNKKVKVDGTDDELTVIVRGDNVFGTTVSKSFSTFSKKNKLQVVTVSISVASYRVVKTEKHGKYAQFLVIFCEGTFRDTVGVWKRYSDFDKLSRLVTRGHESCSSALAGMNPLAITDDPHDHEVLPNAITSWKLLKKRQRWFRCLDAGYLSLKAFLLERFLHDILFECTTPEILRDFVGIEDKTTEKKEKV